MNGVGYRQYICKGASVPLTMMYRIKNSERAWEVRNRRRVVLSSHQEMPRSPQLAEWSPVYPDARITLKESGLPAQPGDT